MQVFLEVRVTSKSSQTFNRHLPLNLRVVLQAFAWLCAADHGNLTQYLSPQLVVRPLVPRFPLLNGLLVRPGDALKLSGLGGR